MDNQEHRDKTYPERDFSPLNTKSPVELIEEMEEAISNMTDEDFDNEQIDAYLSALEEKTSVLTDFDPEKSFDNFVSNHADSLEQLQLSQTAKPKKKKRFRFVQVAAVILAIFFLGTATASAYGVNVFALFVQWGEETLQLGRGSNSSPSGSMQLRDAEGGEYRSMEDALEGHGLSSDVCPTWIPERFSLVAVEVQEDSGEIGFGVFYQDKDKNSLVFSIDYAPGSDAIYTIEKNPDSGQIYIDHGVEYYLVTNTDHWCANWFDETSVYSISGNITEDELKQILTSIYER